MRGSFVFYESFYEALADLDDADRLECLDMICRYALYGEEPEGKGIATAMLKMAKPVIDKNNERFENGKKGGRPKKQEADSETEQKPNRNQTETKPKPNHNHRFSESKPDKDKDVDKDVDVYEEVKKRERFIKPTVEEVRAYCRERGNHIDAEQFVAFYDSKGWKIGKEAMKNWKSAVITWEKRQKEHPPNIMPVKNKFAHQERHEYNFDELADILSKPVGGVL